jgi:hypothetical protein
VHAPACAMRLVRSCAVREQPKTSAKIPRLPRNIQRPQRNPASNSTPTTDCDLWCGWQGRRRRCRRCARRGRRIVHGSRSAGGAEHCNALCECVPLNEHHACTFFISLLEHGIDIVSASEAGAREVSLGRRPMLGCRDAGARALGCTMMDMGLRWSLLR